MPRFLAFGLNGRITVPDDSDIDALRSSVLDALRSSLPVDADVQRLFAIEAPYEEPEVLEPASEKEWTIEQRSIARHRAKKSIADSV